MRIEFISKRNRVYMNDGIVFKDCQNHETAMFEARFLQQLERKGVAVPKVLNVDGAVLSTEYIKGKPLPEFLSEQEAVSHCRAVADAIAYWFECFYAAVGYRTTAEIRGDVNGRNFIVSNESIFSVDFETHAYGKQDTDFGRLLAFIATYSYNNKDAQKKLEDLLFHCFIKSFSVSGDTLSAEKAKELKEMEKRRKNP